MKKLFCLWLSVIGCFILTSCGDDAWGNGDPAMENIYYVGFEDWGQFKNDVTFNVKQGETIGIPVQFWCEFIRPYDVVTYYYVAGDLVRGTDYEIVDANGNALSPDENGAFSLTWEQAKKGVQNVYIKALNGNTGSFYVQTFNPDSDVELTNQDVSTTINNVTNDYEVRIFTQNYRVIVNVIN